MSIKLKSSQIKPLRNKLLFEQNGRCAICHEPCSEDQAVLDHFHGSNAQGEAGYIRAVLHRGCNAYEGKILSMGKRMGIKDVPNFLIGMMAYHKLHATDQTGMTHPLHFTSEEKLERAKAKAKRKRVAAKAAKARP
jgi:hypothetical protein